MPQLSCGNVSVKYSSGVCLIKVEWTQQLAYQIGTLNRGPEHANAAAMNIWSLQWLI